MGNMEGQFWIGFVYVKTQNVSVVTKIDWKGINHDFNQSEN